jgi:hypothetical protein
MNRAPVDSTTLASVAFHFQLHVLELEFRNGALYRYFDVPPCVHDALLEADSKGWYFNHHIRNNFHCQQLRAPGKPVPSLPGPLQPEN